METLRWFWVKTQQRQKTILTPLSGSQIPRVWLRYFAPKNRVSTGGQSAFGRRLNAFRTTTSMVAAHTLVFADLTLVEFGLAPVSWSNNLSGGAADWMGVVDARM